MKYEELPKKRDIVFQKPLTSQHTRRKVHSRRRIIDESDVKVFRSMVEDEQLLQQPTLQVTEKNSRNDSPAHHDQRNSFAKESDKLRNNTADGRFRNLHISADCDSF